MISFKWASGRFSFHFRQVYEKCIEYIEIDCFRSNGIRKVHVFFIIPRTSTPRSFYHSPMIHERDSDLIISAVPVTHHILFSCGGGFSCFGTVLVFRYRKPGSES